MFIEASGLGKRFQKDWIFRNFDYQFEANKTYAITGPNGSGKSTLIKVLSGLMPSTEGKVVYNNGNVVEEEDFYKHLVIAAPYLELIEEYTLAEFIKFHFNFKPIIPGKSVEELIEFAYLEDARNKTIKNFSSGMKQRLKLALCFYSDVSIILLDEPTSNLDKQGINWYHLNAEKLLGNRLTLLCSNIESEYSMCDFRLEMEDFK